MGRSRSPTSRANEEAEEYQLIDPPPEFDGEALAGICTDLWWYSICDEDEFLRRCKRFKEHLLLDAAEQFGIQVIAVEPGVYRFRHNDKEGGDAEEVVYTRFERVRPPDPVQDFIAKYDAMSVNPHAYVQAMVVRWPTLYGGTRKNAEGKEEAIPWGELSEERQLGVWQRVTDDIFFTLGSGVDWHENGFPMTKADPTVPDVEPPSFRAQCRWYPFSKPYGGIFEPKVLTLPFAKLAFRALESVISFGLRPFASSDRGREVDDIRARMQLAVDRYRELMTQYPDVADPEYVTWLSQEGRAEAWVAKFNLGPK